MDIRTLEYMEDRTGKARHIVKKIEFLKANLSKFRNINGMQFFGSSDMKLFSTSSSLNFPRLVDNISKETVDLMKVEIGLLEQELAEL